MKKEEFFVLEHGWATRYYWFDVDIKKEDLKKDTASLIKKEKLTFSIQSGTTPGDIVGGTWVNNYFSERFVTLLKQYNIKLKAYQLKFQKGLHLSMKYYYVEPSAKPVSIINKKGTVRWFTDSQGNRSIMARKGLYLKLKEWDGSDFFMIKNSRIYVVTQQLKELIEKAKLKNVKLENVLDWSFGDV